MSKVDINSNVINNPFKRVNVQTINTHIYILKYIVALKIRNETRSMPAVYLYEANQPTHPNKHA